MAKLLLVEDNEMNRDMLSRRLERKGHRILVAVNGLEALAQAASEQPELILMDLSLPELDGWEATRRLKANPATRTIPVIALTAHAMTGDRESAFAAGVDEYETKPVDLPSLLGKIDALLGKANAQPVANGSLPIAQQGGGLGRGVDEIVAPLPSPSSVEGEAKLASAQPPEGLSRSLHILLVDDALQNRNLILAFLKKTPHRVECAEDGQQAVEKVCAGAYDLVLMDMEMPVMDGYAATARIREWERARGASTPIPIIALTAHSLSEHAEKGQAAGCTGYLEKPIVKARLLEMVNTYAEPRPPSPLPSPLSGARESGEIVVQVDRELEDLIPEFLETTRQEARELEEAAARGDCKKAGELGHATKGAAGGYGFHALGELGGKIEQAGRAGDIDGVRALAREVSSHLDHLRIVIV